MPVVVVESPAKAKTINKYLGPDYTVLASYGHVPGPAPQGRLGGPRERLRDALGGGLGLQEARQGHRRRARPGPRADPRHRPRPRGGGDLLAPPGGADEAAHAQEGHPRQPRGVQRHHQGRGDRGDAQPPPGRRAAGRGLPGAARARLPRGLQPLAGAVAQAAGREVRREGAVGLPAAHRRARDGDRGVQAPRVLVRHRRAGDAGGGTPSRPG